MSKIADEIVREYKMKEYYKKLKESKDKNKTNNSQSNTISKHLRQYKRFE